MIMLSNRPYLLRAFYQWIIDSTCTPILVVDATNPRCKVPRDYVDGGEIIFNVSPDAVRDFKIGSELITFKASFSGVIHLISVPLGAALAVYAEENGEGIFFDGEEEGGTEGSQQSFKNQDRQDRMVREPVPQQNITKSKPILRIVE
jgi:stringent starvation protein B